MQKLVGVVDLGTIGIGWKKKVSDKGEFRKNLGSCLTTRGNVIRVEGVFGRIEGFATIANILGWYGGTLPPHEPRMVLQST